MNNNLNAVHFCLVCFFFFSLIFGCKKKDESEPALQIDSIYDIDSNVYKTVKIGKNWWMAENLKVVHYRNGKKITSASYWDTTITGGVYCSYDNNVNASGLLYNWYAVIDSNNIAPAGWHIATDEEWKEMEIFLGMSEADANSIGWRGTDQGNALKRIGPDGWPEPRYDERIRYTVWGNNKSGFDAVSGGCRLPNGKFSRPSFTNSFWWTSTEKQDTTKQAWYRSLDYRKPNVFRSFCDFNYGMNIRCVKDK